MVIWSILPAPLSLRTAAEMAHMNEAGCTLSAAEKKTIEFGLVRVGGIDDASRQISKIGEKATTADRSYSNVHYYLYPIWVVSTSAHNTSIIQLAALVALLIYVSRSLIPCPLSYNIHMSGRRSPSSPHAPRRDLRRGGWKVTPNNEPRRN